MEPLDVPPPQWGWGYNIEPPPDWWLGDTPDPALQEPLCNVWLTMLHGIGIDPKQLERHGDSTGVMKELNE
jgi:hypothetical protein